jgi:hypothetical protein
MIKLMVQSFIGAALIGGPVFYYILFMMQP